MLITGLAFRKLVLVKIYSNLLNIGNLICKILNTEDPFLKPDNLPQSERKFSAFTYRPSMNTFII